MSPLTAQRRDVINGNYYFALQEYSAAVPWFERALAEGLQTSPTDVSQIAIRQTSLAWCYSAIGRFDDAWRLYKDALTAVRSAEKDGSTLTGTVEEGHPAQAVTTLRDAYRQEVASAGAEHRMSLRALACLGLAEIASGQQETGLADLRTAVTGYERELGAAAAA